MLILLLSQHLHRGLRLHLKIEWIFHSEHLLVKIIKNVIIYNYIIWFCIITPHDSGKMEVIFLVYYS